MSAAGWAIKRLLLREGEEFVGEDGIRISRIVPLSAVAGKEDAVFSVGNEELPENVAGAGLAIVKHRTTRVSNYVLCTNPRLMALGKIGWLLKPDHWFEPRMESGCRVGGMSTAFERLSDGQIVRLAQLGGLHIGANVHWGAFVTIDRGSLNTVNTEIGDDVVIGSHVHIAHNVKVGARTAIMDHACICGSAEIGEEAWIGPRVVVKDHVKIGARAHVGIGSVVLEDVPEGARVMGHAGLITL